MFRVAFCRSRFPFTATTAAGRPFAVKHSRTAVTSIGNNSPIGASEAQESGKQRKSMFSPRTASFSPLSSPNTQRSRGGGYARKSPDSNNHSSDRASSSQRGGRGGNQRPAQPAHPYRTDFPQVDNIPEAPPTRRPYETILTIRKAVHVTSKGKHTKFDAYCLAGDRNGSVGYAHARSTQASKAVQSALRMARATMKHYPLFEGRTLFHDIEAEHRNFKIRLFAKPAGYSVRAQHTIYDICQALGIQDLAAEIQHGATTNPVTITKTFLYALAHQHQVPEHVAKVRGKRVEYVHQEQYGIKASSSSFAFR